MVGIAHTNQRRAEEVGTLGNGAANGDSSRAGAFAGQVSRRSVLVLDEVIGPGQHIVNCVLLGQLLPGQMPILAVFAATAHMRHGEDSAVLKECQQRRPKARDRS